MEHYPHKVSGIYPDKAAALEALEKLRNSGFPDKQLRMVGPRDAAMDAKLEPEGEEIAKEIVKDTAIGMGVGGALGFVGSVAMGIANVALFATNPILGGLMITGYAATVGGVAGAIKGVKIKETAFVAIVEDALKQGYWVVVTHAQDSDEEKRARNIIAETAAEQKASG